MDDPIVLECVFCGSVVTCNTDDEFEKACDAGWTPCFRIGDNVHDDMTHCPACAAKHTTYSDQDGEPVLNQGHEKFLRVPLS